MKKKVLLFICCFLLQTLNILSQKQEEDFQKNDNVKVYKEILNNMLNIGMNDLGSYKILQELLLIGPRLVGTPQAEEAVKFAKKTMEELGLDTIELEPFLAPRWQRGRIEEAKIITPSSKKEIPLKICSLGGSVPTPENGVIANVIEVKSMEELKNYGEKVKGKIVFFNRPMDNSLVNTFRAYGEASFQRFDGALEAAKLGAVGVVIRSLTTSIDDYPHTGMLHYDDNVPKIPAAALSTQSSNILSDFIKKESSAKLYLKLTNKILPPAISYNVKGEIRGAEKPSEVVLIGAHLDSWDLSVGAHDDGAGTAQVLEAMRLIKKLNIKPKRTIRAVLFMDEESGCLGGKEYALSEKRKEEKHIAAIESDTGGFAPIAFNFSSKEAIDKLMPFAEIFEELQIYKFKQGSGGCDISPLSKNGTLTIGLMTNPQRYFDYHHSAKDTIENVHPRELELGAISIAMLSFILGNWD